MTVDKNSVLLGKLLAEVYRLQKKADISTADDAHIYALKNGFESAIENEIERTGFISNAQVKHAMDVLTPYWEDKEKLDSFKGFYDIESKLAAGGVDRTDAIRIFRFLQANGQFTDVLEKMDSSGSPSECRTFEISEWDV